ncbi:hypothetical protein [Ammoniphilus resinae]|uniref:Zn-finger nucleic acid-binding protein n=1 Tax=Ammoniphilus resinae TaxID=861532 RepID=A0ABS4GJ56_9BACL|nr:hypothetical protein [Ammoniphilus resinae]MBP1930294.1 Zn-finger nucleic acid-binding protein [Ammoniphilus resinae]
MLKKLIKKWLGLGSSNKYHKYSSSDYHGRKHYPHNKHGHSYYGHSHYKKKRSSFSFFSS